MTKSADESHSRARRTAFKQSLREYIAADDVERNSRCGMIELLGSSRDPFSREHFDPGHFTASMLVVGPAGLLLIHHAKLDRWLQPGGHVDTTDASLFDAAARELREETGVADITGDRAVFDLDIHPIPANLKKSEPPHAHFDVRFLARTRRTKATAASDALGVRWEPLEASSLILCAALGARVLKKLLDCTKLRKPLRSL